jgi:phospholipid-binding lipoprotein MlaA
MKIKQWLIIILIVFGVSCSSVKVKTEEDENLLKLENSSKNYFKAYDPWEPFNRRVYYFNAKFDDYIFIPVVETYRFVTPNFMERGIHNFFNNLSNIKVFVNTTAQLKGKASLDVFNRFAMNSTFGIFGIFDIATYMGLPKHKEDFGQTLGYYGVKPGPYLVLPIFGPSSLRDATGLAIDTVNQNYMDPFKILDISRNDPEILSFNVIDTRSKNKFRYYETGTPFEYEYLRFLYLKFRELSVKN